MFTFIESIEDLAFLNAELLQKSYGVLILNSEEPLKTT